MKTLTEDRILDKVRALLAKAEATTFPEEAEAFVAGAQRLITQYQLDEAALADHRPPPKVTNREVRIERPYATAKASLLGAIGRHNQCFVVRTGDNCRVFGRSDNIDTVELLFSSLLVQATRALLREPSTSKAYRRSFLLAFAATINARLRDAKRQAENAVASSTALVLVNQGKEAKDAANKYFDGGLRSSTQRASDYRGYLAGGAAARQASFGTRSVGGLRPALGR